MPHPTHFQFVLLILSSLLGGMVNSIAGGGTLLTFPTLLAVGFPPILANGTSTVALVPGSLSAFWAYRRDIGESRANLLELGVVSVIGGLCGAELVVHIGNALFGRLVPYLILGATALFMAQEPIRRAFVSREHGPASTGGRVGILAFQFLVAVYGGFFGAAIGILMLAAFGFLGLNDIHRMNGLKNFCAVCINGVAAATFIASREVEWHAAGLMALGAIAGGFLGAKLARRAGQQNVRRAVVAIGLSIGVYTIIHPLR